MQRTMPKHRLGNKHLFSGVKLNSLKWKHFPFNFLHRQPRPKVHPRNPQRLQLWSIFVYRSCFRCLGMGIYDLNCYARSPGTAAIFGKQGMIQRTEHVPLRASAEKSCTFIVNPQKQDAEKCFKDGVDMYRWCFPRSFPGFQRFDLFGDCYTVLVVHLRHETMTKESEVLSC